MTLIDDTCDGCGSRFDPMGDPLLTRHPEISPYAVYCATCQGYLELKEDPNRKALQDLRTYNKKLFMRTLAVTAIVNELDDLIKNEGVGVDVAAIDIKRRLEKALS